MRRLPPLNSLRAFEAAARSGSFTAAADELSVTPGAVSQQVKQLEDHLGVRLFDRLPRGLRLTGDGHALLPDLAQGLDHVARGVSRVIDKGVSGSLGISLLPAFGRQWILPRLGDFRARYPDLDLHLMFEPGITDFRSGEVDVAVRFSGGSWPGLRTWRLLDEALYPICSPQILSDGRGLRSWDDLRHQPLIHQILPGSEPWAAWKPWLDAYRVTGRVADSGLFLDDSSAVLQATMDGLGVAIGQHVLSADLIAQGRLVRPFAAVRHASLAFYIVAPEAAADQPKVQAFVGWLLEQAAALAAQQPVHELESHPPGRRPT